MCKLLKEKANLHKIDITDEMAEQFNRYENLLIEYNKVMNLTGITDHEGIVVKHFVDSLLGAEFIPLGAIVADIGSGAGFPGVPLKIFRPDLQMYLIDSLNKRVNFLKTVIYDLKLTNVSAEHIRAEDAGIGKYNSLADFCVMRAVAKIDILIKYAYPILKKGGVLIAYKGDKVEDELDLIDTKKVKLIDVKTVCLDNIYTRNFVLVKKI